MSIRGGIVRECFDAFCKAYETDKLNDEQRADWDRCFDIIVNVASNAYYARVHEVLKANDINGALSEGFQAANKAAFNRVREIRAQGKN